MARVMGTLSDCDGGNAPGVQIKFMQKVNNVWIAKYKFTTNAYGDYDSVTDVASGTYSLKIQYPPDSTSPTRACWAHIPMPLDVLPSGIQVVDVCAPCALAKEGEAAASCQSCCAGSRSGKRMYRVVEQDARRVEKQVLKDIKQTLQGTGKFTVTHDEDWGGMVIISRDGDAPPIKKSIEFYDAAGLPDAQTLG